MANLPETATYDAGVYQLETTDPVQGGPSGVSNSPLKNLTNRTAYLKQRVDSIESGSTNLPGYAKLDSPTFTGSPTAPTQALGDNTTKIANTAFVQATVGGRLSKSVAGSGNVTLTAVEAGNAILELTGALTGARSVIVPTSPTRSWIVKNATSGAHVLTVKTASGTGVVVTQGTTAIVWTDGTNVYDALTDFDSPVLTGTPTAPTATPATSTAQLATTEFSTYATDGRVSVNVAGGSNVTLNATQYGAAIIDLTGTITGNINLVFPNISGQWVIANNSGGDFNITAKTVAGTGVVLPKNSAIIAYGDGTNIYAASSIGQYAFNGHPFSPSGGTSTLTVIGGYTPGNIMVEKNGALLKNDVAYTATNGSSISLASPTIDGDTFTVYAFAAFEVANALTQIAGDNRYARLASTNNFTSGNSCEEKPFPATTGTVTLDLAAGVNFGGQLTGNITLANPTGMVAGQSGVIRIKNDAATPRTIAYGSVWKTPGGSMPALTAAAGAVDVFGYYVEPDSRITLVQQPDSK